MSLLPLDHPRFISEEDALLRGRQDWRDATPRAMDGMMRGATYTSDTNLAREPPSNSHEYLDNTERKSGPTRLQGWSSEQSSANPSTYGTQYGVPFPAEHPGSFYGDPSNQIAMQVGHVQYDTSQVSNLAEPVHGSLPVWSSAATTDTTYDTMNVHWQGNVYLPDPANDTMQPDNNQGIDSEIDGLVQSVLAGLDIIFSLASPRRFNQVTDTLMSRMRRMRRQSQPTATAPELSGAHVHGQAPFIGSSALTPTTAIPAVIPGIIAEGQSWTCRYAGCNMIFHGTVSAKVVKLHLKNDHGVERGTILPSRSAKCSWTEPGGSPCSTDVRGLAKHICDVHLRVGAQTCPNCKKKLSRGDSVKRHIEKKKCRALQAVSELPIN